MLSVFIPSVIYAERLTFYFYAVLIFIVIMSVIMLSIVYAESLVFIVMLSVWKLNDIMLSVIYSKSYCYSQCYLC